MVFKDGRLVNFGLSKDDLRNIIRRGDPFMTSGCPGCNRPYYNERPSGPLYNIPRRPTDVEIAEIEKVLCNEKDNSTIVSESKRNEDFLRYRRDR